MGFGRMVFRTGLVITGATVACWFILITATGHSIQPGGDAAFFGAVYAIAYNGFYFGLPALTLGAFILLFKRSQSRRGL